MENDNTICGVCSMLYDTNKHTPRVLINCGHTLCTRCLEEVIDNRNLRKCPFDSIPFKRTQKSLNHFPKNFALSALLEGKSRNTCQIHGDQLKMFCLKDKIKICSECAFLGEHKGHSTKWIKELKGQGAKLKKDLEESLMKFEINQFEKNQKAEVLKKEFLNGMSSKFEEIKDMLKVKELEWTNKLDHLGLFERKAETSNGQSLKDEAEEVLEEIDRACQKEENLAILDQDFSSIISKLETPAVEEEEVFKLPNESSKVMDCMNLFFTDQEKSIKSFDLLNERRKAEQKQQQLSSENLIESKQKPAFFKTNTLFALEVCDICDMCLFIRVENPNPIDFPVNLEEAYNKIERIFLDLDQYDSLDDLNYLYEIFHQLKNYTSLVVSFAPEGLTDGCALNLLNVLFCKIQNLAEIEISFEQCDITNEPILFFCNNLLPKATSLTNLTLQLGCTLLNDLSLSALSRSLSPLSENLESFTLGAGHTAITDNGIEEIFPVVWEVKELNLQLQGTLVTDRSLKELGNQMMLCMKNLEKLTLVARETKITIESISPIFTGIPKNIKYLNLDFEKVNLSDNVVSLFEEKVCPKLGLVEEVYLKLERSNLEAEVSKLLERVRNETEKTKDPGDI